MKEVEKVSQFRISPIELVKLLSIVLCMFGTAAAQGPVSFADHHLKTCVEDTPNFATCAIRLKVRMTLYARSRRI